MPNPKDDLGRKSERSKMRSVLCCGLLISWWMLVQAMAQSPFDGVWKAEPTESHHHDGFEGRDKRPFL